MPKLSAECFPVIMVKPLSSLETLKMLYYSYFHSDVNYGIMWGEIPHAVILFVSYKIGLSEL